MTIRNTGAILLSIFFISSGSFLACENTETCISGPLYGKNYYLPHLLTYSFPGFSPRAGKKKEKVLSVGYYGINEFLTYNEEEIAIDYESSILEGSLTFRLEEKLLLGLDLRLISYYGGFMDSVIEWWHSLGKFPNGDREFFPVNDVNVSVDNDNGRNLYMSKPSLSLGDTDVYCIWTVKEDFSYALAFAGAVKIPTGSFNNISGSGNTDVGIQILGEWCLNQFWSFHLQQGFVVPFDSIFEVENKYASRIQSQSLFSIQFFPKKDWSIITQIKLNTSPISSNRDKTTDHLGTLSLFTLPQTSLQIGIKKAFDNTVCQIYIEEDPFTYEGVDILISFRLSQHFNMY